MTESRPRSMDAVRDEIVGSLTPVRPLAAPSRRVWMLVPFGIALAATAPLLEGGARANLASAGPLLTWGLTGLQTLLGLWLLALGFREAVPGRNVSGRALALATILTISLVVAITLVTNAASHTGVPAGKVVQFWIECVILPMAFGVPLLLVTTLMAVRAFPTRPAIAGGLCGMSAGVLSDAGWRLTCWISDPAHVTSHGVSIVILTLAGALLAVAVDAPRWRRLRTDRRASR